MKQFAGVLVSSILSVMITSGMIFSPLASAAATGDQFRSLLSNYNPLTCQAAMLETPQYTCPDGFPLNCQNGKCCPVGAPLFCKALEPTPCVDPSKLTPEQMKLLQEQCAPLLSCT